MPNKDKVIKGSLNRDALTLSEISRWLIPGEIGARIEIHDEIDSTNNRAKELALQGASHGTAVLARRQSAGRGRFGRNFHSPDESGIYISFVLRPSIPADRAVMITSMAAVAVARARSNVIGRDVFVLRGGDRYPARVLDIDENGSLVVRTSDGRQDTLHSGEISIRFS